MPSWLRKSNRPADYRGEFSWSAKEQGLLLSGFSIGYVFTQLLGGYLSERFGGKWVLGISTFVCGVLSMLIPIMAKIGGDNPLPVFAVRVLQGLFQGPALPATYAMAAKWLPRPEKTRLMAVISAGSPQQLEVHMTDI